MRTRRPPLAYIELLSAPEDEFRRTVEEVEEDPLFQELHARGLVKRRGGRGPMSREAYEERMDREVAAFVARYGVGRRRGGLEKLREAIREEGVDAVARSLGAPAAEVQRVARFLLETPAAEAPAVAPAEAEPAPELDDFVAGTPTVDITEATETVRDFVRRHSLSEHQLVADFLHGDLPPAELARRYRTTEEAVRRVMGAVTFVLTADIVAGGPQPAGGRRREPRDTPPVVGRVYLRDGEPQLHFGEDTGYGLRYVIAPAALEELDDREKRENAEELLHVLRHINQRRSVQCRVVAALFDRQRAYFASGKEIDLRPVSQADLARELKEHQSTISRAVRGRYLDTPYGAHELQFYCQRKQEVIARLGEAYPQAGDRELQRLLRDRYDCALARRTVAYHRRGGRR